MLEKAFELMRQSKSLGEWLGRALILFMIIVLVLIPFEAILIIASLVLKEFGWFACIEVALGLFFFYGVYLHIIKNADVFEDVLGKARQEQKKSKKGGEYNGQ